MNIVVVIPARYKSSRFPGKPLVPLLGKPMVVWVAELSAKAVGQENVYIASDDERIIDVVEGSGYKSVLTTSSALTGTDRLAEVASKVEADMYINVQGDEPLVDPADIIKIIEAKKTHPNEVICGYNTIATDEAQSVNVPKVIFNESNQMVYMSRSVLPGCKTPANAPKVFYRQVCVYAFNKQELMDFGTFGRKSTLEQYEDIEILRFLEWGQKIRLVETGEGSMAIDIPEDVEKVERALKTKVGES